MHSIISVAVATRHRWPCIKTFVDSFIDTTESFNRPALTVIHDSPEQSWEDQTVEQTDFLSESFPENYIRSVLVPEKSSLTELWNWCVMLAPTDWVLICNDDVTFNPGWVEYLEEQIVTDKYDMIHLFHYGAMCLHKRLILKCGWFDENFRGGGFEDVSHQLRISEAGLKDRVDRSHDFIRKEGNVEIGHFMNHHRDVQANGSWNGKNNADYMCEKWGRKSPYDYRIPSFRKRREIDWHPAYTKKYEHKYGIKSQINKINKEKVGFPIEIYL